DEILGIGEGMLTKINANIGIGEGSDIEEELKKGKIAVKYGADTLMDLSISNFDDVRRKFLKSLDVPIGTVPIYQAYIEKQKDMDADYVLNVIEKNLKNGVSFATIHAGITKSIVGDIKKFGRRIPITSRGGALLAAWMLMNDSENPLYENFEYIAEMFLGPLPTDIALGYDHIAAAIGSAVGAMHGVDFICYVTPEEHYSLPDIEGVKSGVIASKIAAHIADICKLNYTMPNENMTTARRNLNWAQIFKCGIDKNLKKPENLKNKKPCTMCGEYCALKITEKYFE
ncbi:MAG: hypothetical protein CVT88_08990, partial [Candidatus Altiarchaeales archaeon HGW-Altiarchaeales-1]